MYRYNYNYNGKMGKGYQQKRKSLKRIAAIARNSCTFHSLTKAHRLKRCECG